MKGLALAQVAISSYLLGYYTLYKRNYNYAYFKYNIRYFKVIYLILSVLFLIYILNSIVYQEGTIELDTRVVSIYVVLFSLVIYLNTLNNASKNDTSIKTFFSANKNILLSAFLILIACLFFGDRGPAVQIVLIMLYIFNKYVRKIRPYEFLIIIIIGAIIMTFISYTRTSLFSLKQKDYIASFSYFINKAKEFKIYDFAMDLIGTSRNMYVGLEHVDSYGYLYGKSYFPIIFSPIPLVPSFVTKGMFDKTPEELSTAYIITKKVDIEGGLGTNAAVDLYMNFGTLGVLIGFFCFGILISFLESGKSVISEYSYLLLFALSIYYPRSTLFIQFSNLIRGIILLSIILYFSKQNRKYTYGQT